MWPRCSCAWGDVNAADARDARALERALSSVRAEMARVSRFESLSKTATLSVKEAAQTEPSGADEQRDEHSRQKASSTMDIVGNEPADSVREASKILRARTTPGVSPPTGKRGSPFYSSALLAVAGRATGAVCPRESRQRRVTSLDLACVFQL